MAAFLLTLAKSLATFVESNFFLLPSTRFDNVRGDRATLNICTPGAVGIGAGLALTANVPTPSASNSELLETIIIVEF